MTTRAQLKAFPGWDWGDGRNGIEINKAKKAGGK